MFRRFLLAAALLLAVVPASAQSNIKVDFHGRRPAAIDNPGHPYVPDPLRDQHRRDDARYHQQRHHATNRDDRAQDAYSLQRQLRRLRRARRGI